MEVSACALQIFSSLSLGRGPSSRGILIFFLYGAGGKNQSSQTMAYEKSLVLESRELKASFCHSIIRDACIR